MPMILQDLSPPMRHPVRIPQGTTVVPRNRFVELRDGGGSGGGEGASWHASTAVTADGMRADRARVLGLRVMVGCVNEGSAGISAIAQLLPPSP